MTGETETTEPIVTVLEGSVRNGKILDVAFPFYTGPAGVRGKGDGIVEFAYFRAPTDPKRWKGEPSEGRIGDRRYRALSGKVSASTDKMFVVVAQRIADDPA